MNLLNKLGINLVSRETEQYDEAYAKASALFYNKSLHQAFKFSNKDLEEAEKRYGKSRIGYSLYLASRLVKCGAQYLVIETGNWDDHNGINPMMRRRLPPFDQAVSAALDDVGDFTRFVIGGEFGRTPKINLQVGRDHWAYSYFTVVAGAGITGQVLGVGGNSRDISSGVPLPGSLLGDSALRVGGCARVWIENGQRFPAWQDEPSGFFNQIYS